MSAPAPTFSARNGNTTHILDRTQGTRFGTRFIARCGASALQIKAGSNTFEASCPRCAAKDAR